ncbi:HAD family hydrolase [Methanospirillum sp.]|uniref:HAD family hydrolase n=1 Tax=Methanospirillum sp. TaxID=45200 RepID=UPI00345D2EAF
MNRIGINPVEDDLSSMSIAVVFDSAGTLLHTYRIVKDVISGQLFPDVETTMLTFEDPDRVLCVIHAHSRGIMDTPEDHLLSDFLRENKIGFGISCTRRVIDADEIGQILMTDKSACMGDMQQCMRIIWSKIKQEAIVALNSGVIVHIGQGRIEFTVTAGGTPFPGAKETIREIHRMGIATFIASGDREAKLERMADYLGIPRDRVFGVATPTMKERIVRDLKSEYDTVVMVGDSINDLLAMRSADIAVLTEQQCSLHTQKHDELIAAVKHRIHDVREVLEIIRPLI